MEKVTRMIKKDRYDPTFYKAVYYSKFPSSLSSPNNGKMNWTQIRDTFSTQCSVESWVYIAHLVFEEGGHTIHNQWPSVANDAFDIWLCVYMYSTS